MESLSIFDIFKIGVGPSSSHTLGPWRAAQDFLKTISTFDTKAVSIQVELYGSLSKTGKGHGTDIAVIMGLLGHDAVTVDTSLINEFVAALYEEKQVLVNDSKAFFDPSTQLIFKNSSLERHPNAMKCISTDEQGKKYEQIYYSVGGGFIELEGQSNDSDDKEVKLPFPIAKASELLAYCQQENKNISDIVYANELAFRSEEEIKTQLRAIHKSILNSIYKGCHTSGKLPGGLNVTRRAKEIALKLLPSLKETDNMVEWLSEIKNTDPSFNTINKWISCFALAVNEENAAFGRVVTSPTNGAAGVIPAVLLFYICFCDEMVDRAIERFFYVAGEIGSLFKKGATISAAMGGCQAEIGVSSAMAAAALTEIQGGTPAQVLEAAEIAMEHHLGMTCDPIGGLVQIPCIERNAMGAIKAITASNIALSSTVENAIVSLDTVIKTMWETAQDMNFKYKETAEGGLAINLSVIQPEC